MDGHAPVYRGNTAVGSLQFTTNTQLSIEPRGQVNDKWARAHRDRADKNGFAAPGKLTRTGVTAQQRRI